MHSKSSGFFPYQELLHNTPSNETIDEGVKSNFADLRGALGLTLNKDLDASAISNVKKFNRAQNTLLITSALFFVLLGLILAPFIIVLAP